MKRFIHLTIKHQDTNKLQALLSTMSEAKGYPFSYQKQASAEYAKNVFLEPDHAACFKTGRKTLFEAVVWVVISNNSFVVTNITSTLNSNLGITNYNKILNVFFDDFASKFIDQTYEVFKTGEHIQISEVLSENTYKYLHAWVESCDKLSPISNFVDRTHWLNFVLSEHEMQDELYPEDFVQWLMEDCRWNTPSLIKSAEKMGEYYEYGRDLLNQQDIPHETEE